MTSALFWEIVIGWRKKFEQSETVDLFQAVRIVHFSRTLMDKECLYQDDV